MEAGQRAGELSKQALKIFQQIANDGSSQYLYLFVASSAVLSRGGSRVLEAPVQALGGGDGGGGLRGGVAAGGAGVFGRGGVVEPSGSPLGSGEEAAFCGLLLRF